MNFRKLRLITSVFLVFSNYIGTCQPTITGPTCVTVGTEYLYIITGKWDTASTIQVCVSGGTLIDSNSRCSQTGKPVSYMRIMWDSVLSGSIQLNSSIGNISKSVQVSQPLEGGSILAASNQSIQFNSTPSQIVCSASSGGSCAPKYQYQWQESMDMVIWSDMKGATSQNLTLTTAKKITTFFRRKVTDATSGSIAYSQVASVFVAAGPPGTLYSRLKMIIGNEFAITKVNSTETNIQ